MIALLVYGFVGVVAFATTYNALNTKPEDARAEYEASKADFMAWWRSPKS